MFNINRGVAIAAEIPINIFSRNKEEVLAGLLKQIISYNDLDVDIYKSNPILLTGADLIKTLDISQFSSLIWVLLSKTRYQKESNYILSKDKPEYDIIIRRLLEILNQKDCINLFMIGDIKEVLKCLDVVSEIKMRDIDIGSNIMTPNPYNNNYITNNISIFDKNIVFKKFVVGEDGSGKLNKENILWLAKNFKSEICIGVLEREDFMEKANPEYDVASYVSKLYKLCLSIIASTKEGGAAMIKMSIPNTIALRSITALFSIFFSSINIIKLAIHTPDDDTIFLSGNNFKLYVSEIDSIISILLDNEIAVLNLLEKEVTSFNNNIAEVLSDKIKEWVNRIQSVWNTRFIHQ